MSRRSSRCKSKPQTDTSDTPSIRLATYNVLSPPLCSKSWFPQCKEENVMESKRYMRLEKQLLSQIAVKAIICLQEVDLLWYGKLSTFFEQNDYYCTMHHYKSIMGVAIAFPHQRFTLVDLVAERVGDFIRPPAAPEGYDPTKPAVSTPAFSRKPAAPPGLWTTVTSTASWLCNYVGSFFYVIPVQLLKAIDEYEQISEANRRQNVFIMATVKDKLTGQELCIATYHMPCAFTQPIVMSLHTLHLALRVIYHAAGRPCALLGDFNFQPDSDSYKLLTTGSLDPVDKGNVTLIKKNDQSIMKLPQTMESGVKSIHGQEPDFTNNAVNKFDAFIGTLDYVWMVNGLKAVDAVVLPHRDQVTDGPYPNEREPSDHVLVWCDVVFE